VIKCLQDIELGIYPSINLRIKPEDFFFSVDSSFLLPVSASVHQFMTAELSTPLLPILITLLIEWRNAERISSPIGVYAFAIEISTGSASNRPHR
jgi:hypothetical protein